ncbi:MAG: DUF4440 domain-containing protein [Deinococcales bacterium]
MRPRLGWLLLLAALLVPSLAWAQPCEAEADVSAAKAAIAQVWDQYETARNAGDLATWLALWDENAVLMEPGREAVAGMESLRTEVSWGSEDSRFALQAQETEVCGQIAYSRGSFTVDVLDQRGGVVDQQEGTFLSVLRQQADGSWKIYRHAEHLNPAAD